MTVCLSEAESHPGAHVQVSDTGRTTLLAFYTYKIAILLQDAAIVMVVKEYFFPCYVSLPSYVHNFVLFSSL